MNTPYFFKVVVADQSGREDSKIHESNSYAIPEALEELAAFAQKHTEKVHVQRHRHEEQSYVVRAYISAVEADLVDENIAVTALLTEKVVTLGATGKVASLEGLHTSLELLSVLMPTLDGVTPEAAETIGNFLDEAVADLEDLMRQARTS